MSDIDKKYGLYRKYDLYRVKQHGSDWSYTRVQDPFFALRYTIDPHAAVALRAYADSCADDYPHLAADLRRALDTLAAASLAAANAADATEGEAK